MHVHVLHFFYLPGFPNSNLRLFLQGEGASEHAQSTFTSRVRQHGRRRILRLEGAGLQRILVKLILAPLDDASQTLCQVLSFSVVTKRPMAF